MAFIPLNARASVTPQGGVAGAWDVEIDLIDFAANYTNNDVVVGCLLFTFDTSVGHMVAWQVDLVNNGQAPPPFGTVPLRVSYYDPRSIPSVEPVTGPAGDVTGFICQPTPEMGLILIDSYQLNVQEQRKAAEIENLNKLFILDQPGFGTGGTRVVDIDTSAAPVVFPFDGADGEMVLIHHQVGGNLLTVNAVNPNAFAGGASSVFSDRVNDTILLQRNGQEIEILARVNATDSAAGIQYWTDLLDTPNSITPDEYVRGNATATMLEFNALAPPAAVQFINDEFQLTALDIQNGFVRLSGSPLTIENVFAFNETLNVAILPNTGFTLAGNTFTWIPAKWGPGSTTPFSVNDILSIRWV